MIGKKDLYCLYILDIKIDSGLLNSKQKYCPPGFKIRYASLIDLSIFEIFLRQNDKALTITI